MPTRILKRSEEIIVDTREQRPLIFPRKLMRCPLRRPGSRLPPSQTLYSLTVSKQRLPAGDYTAAGLKSIVGVERKGSFAELAVNFSKTDAQRFFRAIEKHLDTYDHPYLYLECLPSDLWSLPPWARDQHSPIKPVYLLDMLTELIVEGNLHLIWGGRASSAVHVRRRLGEIIARILLSYSEVARKGEVPHATEYSDVHDKTYEDLRRRPNQQ